MTISIGPGRLIYIEPFSGISGDMMLGALLDLGLDLAQLEQKLRLLPLEGYRLSAGKCLRAGILATKLDVAIGDSKAVAHAGHEEQAPHGHRSFRDIRNMIEGSRLSDWVKQRSIMAFERLAAAEGKVHGQAPDEVHFHEIGAVDSIVDIVGSMIGMEELMPARVMSSAVNVGHGTLKCRHGIYPVPGPATQELLRGIPTFANAISGELTTPTGAALLVALAECFGPRPLMKVVGSGFGAGARETKLNANVLRVTVGEEIVSGLAAPPEDQVAVVEATIDDMNPQIFGHFQEKALIAGALDVYFTPIQMKKGRPAIELTMICALEQLDLLARLVFKETSTIGIRYTIAKRKTLEREFRQVHTDYGDVTIKIALLDGRLVNFVPEFEDCRRLATDKGVPLKEVLSAAAHAYLQCKKSEDVG